MFAPAALADPDARPTSVDAAPADDLARDIIERQLAILGRLAEAGLNIALAIERQALAGEGEADAPPPATVTEGDVALAYSRTARAVRLTVALQGRVLKDLQGLDDAQARLRVRAAADAARRAEVEAGQRRARTERIVERVILATARDAEEGERLADAAFERLEHDDIYGDLARRPASEIVAKICEDLGLHPDWSRLAQEAWAQEELARGAGGAPLMALRCADAPPDAEADEAGPPPRPPPSSRWPARS